jgi:thiamine biosynthesis lipoprotein
MYGKRKHKTQVLSVIISLFVLGSCQETTDQHTFHEIHGETQGTTYSIIIVEDKVTLTKDSIDSLFSAFDASLSTYIPTSVISQLNNSKNHLTINDETGFFKKCYTLSEDVYAKTNGAFDPSVFPLVKGWGFMSNMETPRSQSEVDSILTFVSFQSEKLHSIRFDGALIELTKKHSSFQLDFNAIAQGLSVDVVADFLTAKGYKNYYIEIGGELIVRGHNRDGEKWKIGVDTPKENLTERELNAVLSVSNRAIATSGNYRKFYEVDGMKYAHTLDPTTGFPVQHSLLSVTVIANDAARADAYATAFMVMGADKTLAFVKSHPKEQLEVYLLYANDKGEILSRMSDGFLTFLEE